MASTRLKEESLNFALVHALKHGDTDVFPTPFEYHAIKYNWEEVLKHLSEYDLLNWNHRQLRRCLAPKGRYGFRITTQLDPLDQLVYTSAIYELAADIELVRISANENVVHSYRFLPDSNGNFFDSKFGYSSFRECAKELADSNQYKYVVIADIADFYPRVYLHPLENALSSVSNLDNHVALLKRLLKHWNSSVSYGIPVGQSASRILAELVLTQVDEALLSEGIKYCRFVDDFFLFCNTERDAYHVLSTLADLLFELLGLTLQQKKTEIVTIEHFRSHFLDTEIDKELNNLAENFEGIIESLGLDNPYEPIDFDSLDPKIQRHINNLNLDQLLSQTLDQEQIEDYNFVRFLLRRLSQVGNFENAGILFDNENAIKLYPVFNDLIRYLESMTLNSESAYSRYDYPKIGKYLISLINTSTIGHLPYHRMWILSLFAQEASFNNSNEIQKLLNSGTDEFTKRKAILALGKMGSTHWFKSHKRNSNAFGSWQKRAFLYGASCLPGDEADHWYRSLKCNLDVLEKSITKWALVNRINK